jgi:hypothetical protein
MKGQASKLKQALAQFGAYVFLARCSLFVVMVRLSLVDFVLAFLPPNPRLPFTIFVA